MLFQISSFFTFVIVINLIECDTHYNIPDPECSGPFGLCTQRDKDVLGYRAVKKLHELIDDDHDGQVEEVETNEFMKEELQYKHGFERKTKLHGSDSLITVDELWKSWKHSEVHNWTTDDVVFWLVDQVKLPQYTDNIRRNHIDGQFLPRFAVNENNYYSVVMQIKDPRHRNRMMLKATDLVLFGQQSRPNSLIKDIFMLTALTLSLFGCIFAFSKHRKSQEQIKQMMKEFDQIGSDESNLLTFKDGKIQRKTDKDSAENAKLIDELKLAKDEAENLKKARESTISELQRLKLAEQELETVRMALQQTERQLSLTKYQAPLQLVQMLSRTYESEKELLEFKFKLIDQEKEMCLEELNKVSKRQSGILGALKIAHSSALEDINSKLELLKCQIQRCKIEKQEWTKRWTSIDDIISRNGDASNSNISDSTSQDFPYNDDTAPKSVYNLVATSINAFGIANQQQQLIDEQQQKQQQNGTNNNSKLRVITSSAKIHSSSIQAAAATPPIHFSISEEGIGNQAKINNNNNLLAPNSTSSEDDKTPTNSTHNIQQKTTADNDLSNDRASNYSLNADKDVDSLLYTNTIDSMNNGSDSGNGKSLNGNHFSSTNLSSVSATLSSDTKRRSKTLLNFRKILPFVKATKKVKVK